MKPQSSFIYRIARRGLSVGALGAALVLGASMINAFQPSPVAAQDTAGGAAQALTDEIQGHLDRAQTLLDKLVAVQGPRTVENTLTVMNDIGIELDAASSKSSLMENVHPDPAVRAAAETASQDVQAFATKLSLNRDVYDAVVAVDTTGATPVTERLVEHTLRDYRRSGVDKDEATRARIQKLQEELVKIGQDFDRNIREGTRSIYVDGPKDLEGLPEDYIAAHQPDSTGKIKITTDYPDYLPFMSYARNGEARKRLYEEFTNRAYPKNREVLKQLLEKRYELAQLLGYENWAAYVTEDKMVKSPENAEAFIEKLDEAAKPRAAEDYAMLLARKQKDYPNATSVEEWEKSYYSELVKAEQFDYDSQEIRQYFSFPKVEQGVLDVTSKLFGVTYKRVTDTPVWDPSVECYDMFEGDQRIGRFYFDLHPRAGKFSHAAQFTMQTGVEGRQIPIGVLVCNFPGGKEGDPGLMEHDDVETFFHEFGHLLHHEFGGHQKWINFSGVATEWDFVEAPSQMLEEWTYDTPTLQTFAVNYKTGKPIPNELVAKLRAARGFGNGTYVTQQNFYTAISLDIYDRPPDQVDLNAVVPALQAKYGMFAYVPGSHMYASFGHLDGYSAMYYTYMWSLVIAKDLFSHFNHANLLDPTIATEYRRDVLEPGGTQDAAKLVEHFLGRPYSFDAFREWLNKGAS